MYKHESRHEASLNLQVRPSFLKHRLGFDYILAPLIYHLSNVSNYLTM